MCGNENSHAVALYRQAYQHHKRRQTTVLFYLDTFFIFVQTRNKTKNLLHIVAQTLSAASREEEVGERERDKRKEEWHTPERSLA